MNGTSIVCDMEMMRLDREIEKTRKQFYTALLGKKRRVKRKWLEISAMTNAHLLQTLPYRAMLGHVAKLAEERDKVISEMGNSSTLTQHIENDNEDCSNEEGGDDNDEDSKNTLSIPQNKIPAEGKEASSNNARSARDEAIQTEESCFSTES